jgi:hypothetical protein
MERPVELLPIIEEIEKQQESSSLKLKDIQIVTLNTVYPEILKKFKTPLLLNKLNDAGGEFIEAMDVLNVYAKPAHSNPTCPNTAAALIISLGFKEIYFIGTDFGYISKKHHHAKDSIYYDEEFRITGIDQAGIDCYMTENMKRKGNFRQFVYSTEVFDSSRKQIEFLLSENLDVNAYNCADGASIIHTKPMRMENIELNKSSRNKELNLEILLEDAFDNEAFTTKKFDNHIKKTFHVLKVTLDQLMLIVNKKVNSREELADLFSAQDKLLSQLLTREEYKFNYWMIQGTFKYLQTYIMSNSFMYEDLIKRNEFMNHCLDIFRRHVDFLFIELTNSTNVT